MDAETKELLSEIESWLTVRHSERIRTLRRRKLRHLINVGYLTIADSNDIYAQEMEREKVRETSI